MGDSEVLFSDKMESPVKYHPDIILNLILSHESGEETVLGG